MHAHSGTSLGASPLLPASSSAPSSKLSCTDMHTLIGCSPLAHDCMLAAWSVMSGSPL